MTTELNMDLIEQLKAASKGAEEWRVADPKDGCYCMAFTRCDSINPEREAREWLENHRKTWPNSRHAHYEVRRVIAQNSADMLMIEAADELERLRAESAKWQALAEANALVAECCQSRNERAARLGLTPNDQAQGEAQGSSRLSAGATG